MPALSSFSIFSLFDIILSKCTIRKKINRITIHFFTNRINKQFKPKMFHKKGGPNESQIDFYFFIDFSFVMD